MVAVVNGNVFIGNNGKIITRRKIRRTRGENYFSLLQSMHNRYVFFFALHRFYFSVGWKLNIKSTHSWKDNRKKRSMKNATQGLTGESFSIRSMWNFCAAVVRVSARVRSKKTYLENAEAEKTNEIEAVSARFEPKLKQSITFVKTISTAAKRKFSCSIHRQAAKMD